MPNRALGFFLGLLAASPASAQRVDRIRVGARLDSIARAPIAAHQAAGLAVAVVRGRDTLLARGYGLAEVENRVPMTIRHVFEIASITKEFTAAAVLSLVEDGKLSLDDDVTKFLPDAPTQGRAVSVRMLLSHTSGLADVPDLPAFQRYKRRTVSPDSVIALARNEPFYFAPGEQMRYSNTGFLLAGRLIEVLTGRSYADYVTERLFRRAGMADSRYCDQRALVPLRVRGYDFTPSGFRPADFIDLGVPFAAGGLCSTAPDLIKWATALDGGRIIGSAAYAEMTRPVTLSGGRRNRYGLGLGLGTMAGRRVYHHGGDIDGFTTYLARFPDDSLTIAVLINTQGPARPEVLVERLAEAVLGSPRIDRVPPPPDLERFGGQYGDIAKVEATGRGLELAWGPRPPAPLRFQGGTTFTDGRALYTFDPGEGRPTTLWADVMWAFVKLERRPAGHP